MKRVLNVRGLGVAVLLLASWSLVARQGLATTAPALRAQEDGTVSVGMWYLGPNIGNVTGYLGNVYYNTVLLTAYSLDPNPDPTITYSTNQPLLLSLSPSGAPYACAPYTCANLFITAIGNAR